MANYACPFATRLRQHRYIMCKAIMREKVDYTLIMNASNVFCPYQYYCRITGQTENTDRARDCYAARLKQLNQSAD